MSAPSRRPEIRRRRTRKEKIKSLQKRLSMATSEVDKKNVSAKLHKLSLASPGYSLTK
jgi:hypothetical protein